MRDGDFPFPLRVLELVMAAFDMVLCVSYTLQRRKGVIALTVPLRLGEMKQGPCRLSKDIGIRGKPGPRFDAEGAGRHVVPDRSRRI